VASRVLQPVVERAARRGVRPCCAGRRLADPGPHPHPQPGRGCAFDHDTLIGFVNVAWDGDLHAFLIDTAVLKRYERQGVGRRLVALAAERARAAGCQWLHVDFDAEGLRRFYFDACGFRPTTAGLIDLTAPAPSAETTVSL
jgi:GNAT superfamily N-acetyltransferase